jgi:hypothetical protein
MKDTLILWITLFINACGQQSEEKTAIKKNQFQFADSISKSDKKQKIELTQTSTKVPKLIIPLNVYLDSISTFYKSNSLTIDIVLPKSKDKGLFSADKLLNSLIIEKKNNFIESVNEMLKEEPILKTAIGSEFIVYPVELYKNENVLSYLLYISVYRAGAPHPKSDFFTFNYDIKSKKQIRFSDYFTFKSKTEKDSLLHLINSTFENEYIKADKFYDFDFNFNEKTISFNFDDYEIASYAEGMQRASIDKNKLYKYIKPIVRQ